jgi:hypothetical protein
MSAPSNVISGMVDRCNSPLSDADQSGAVPRPPAGCLCPVQRHRGTDGRLVTRCAIILQCFNHRQYLSPVLTSLLGAD